MRALLSILVFALGLIGPLPGLKPAPGADGQLAGQPMPAGIGPAGLALLVGPALARSSQALWPGPFPVDVIRVADGDTVEVMFREGPCGRGPCPGAILFVRILDIDAPEAHLCHSRSASTSGGYSCAACPQEYELGRQALAFTRSFLGEGEAVRVRALRPDKYAGRIVASLEVLRDGRWALLGDALLAVGLAVPYDGGRKSKPWCAGDG